MKTIFNGAIFFSLAAAAMTLAQVAKADIVYQNSTGDLNYTLNPGASEVGDQIILGAGGRSLTNFTFQYTLTGTAAATAQFRIYANDGALFNGFASPGTTLFDSGTFSINSGTHTLIFDQDFGTGLLVPDSFTWSVQFSDIADGSTVGPDLFNPVTVGGNYDDFWQNDGTGWQLKHATNGPVTSINFAAQAEVVPEPSTIALGLLGCVLGWGFTRRNRS